MILLRLCNYFARCVQLDEFIRREQMGVPFVLHRHGPVECPSFPNSGAPSCGERKSVARSGRPPQVIAAFRHFPVRPRVERSPRGKRIRISRPPGDDRNVGSCLHEDILPSTPLFHGPALIVGEHPGAVM